VVVVPAGPFDGVVVQAVPVIVAVMFVGSLPLARVARTPLT
jgi:hypothetical protein